MRTIVFVTDEKHCGARPGQLQPAYRAWADALLLRATEDDFTRAPTLQMRTTAQIGRVAPTDFYTIPLEVDRAICGAAMKSDSLRLFFPPQWREDLLDHLVELNFPRELVKELVMPCAAPMVLLHVSALRDVFAETPSEIIHAIASYFARDIAEYVESIFPVGEMSFAVNREVIIPPAASIVG